MYMKKNSPFTPFISHALMKTTETGVKNILSKRHIISEPNCKPLRKEGRSLGMLFFLSIFLAYSVCWILCLIILLFEYVHKPENSKRSVKTLSKSDILNTKIDDYIKNLQSSLDKDKILLQRKLTYIKNSLNEYVILQCSTKGIK